MADQSVAVRRPQRDQFRLFPAPRRPPDPIRPDPDPRGRSGCSARATALAPPSRPRSRPATDRRPAARCRSVRGRPAGAPVRGRGRSKARRTALVAPRTADRSPAGADSDNGSDRMLPAEGSIGRWYPAGAAAARPVTTGARPESSGSRNSSGIFVSTTSQTMSGSTRKYTCESQSRIPAIFFHSMPGIRRAHVVGDVLRRFADDLDVPQDGVRDEFVLGELLPVHAGREPEDLLAAEEDVGDPLLRATGHGWPPRRSRPGSRAGGTWG